MLEAGQFIWGGACTSEVVFGSKRSREEETTDYVNVGIKNTWH
jgi:hypothetical protein